MVLKILLYAGLQTLKTSRHQPSPGVRRPNLIEKRRLLSRDRTHRLIAVASQR
jgi:hypothetical protein